MPCNICDDKLQAQLLGGTLDETFHGSHETNSRNCPDCQARPRTKTFRLAYDQHARPLLHAAHTDGGALDLAGIRATVDILSRNHDPVVNAALVGRKVTTDIRELAEFDDASFAIVTACEILDYVLEHDHALAAVRRVLKPGGVALIHIEQQRLTKDVRDPEVAGWIENLGGSYPPDYRVPSVRVGRDNLLGRLAAHGFHGELYDYVDPFSGYSTPWFLGWRTAW